MNLGKRHYLEVIVPLKFNGGITYYYVPEGSTEQIERGSWVVVTMVHKRYLAVVNRSDCPLPGGLPAEKILPIEKVAGVRPLPSVPPEWPDSSLPEEKATEKVFLQ